MGNKRENRKQPRVPFDALVQIRSDSVQQFRAVHAKNLSTGGMFIDTSQSPGVRPREKGAEIYFQFTVKDGGTLIEGLGRVVHVDDNGFGIEFISVLEPSKSVIEILVAQRLETQG
jgi:hypothetical protein